MSVENAIKKMSCDVRDNEVLCFINSMLSDCVGFENDVAYLFTHGYCYYFAVILKTAFRRGEVSWVQYHGHIVWKDIDGVCYDSDGVYEAEDNVVPVEHLGDMLYDFMHMGKEYTCTNKELHEIFKSMGISDTVGMTKVYKYIPSESIDYEKTVEQNTIAHFMNNMNEVREILEREYGRI